VTESHDAPTLPDLLPDREAYQQRLEQIVPQSITGVTDTANPAAAATAFTMMYVGAVNGTNPIRPSTVTWMSDEIAAHRDEAERRGYYKAAMRSEKAVLDYCALSGFERGPSWYAKDSREPIRDQSIKALIENGAVIVTANVQTTAQTARYTFTPEFAALLSPDLTGDALTEAIVAWQRKHLTPTGRARARRQYERERAAAGVSVRLPDGTTRVLHVGQSSEILKGVIEQFTARLLDPSVIFISQSGEKINVVDDALLKRLGLPVDQQRLLPDCLIADLDPARDEFWFVEIVASDGPLTDARKARFLEWAISHGLNAGRCHFLTAFASRTSGEAKKALPVLARGSYGWFADEPDALLSWEDLRRGPPVE
jgi:hypothetical protein